MKILLNHIPNTLNYGSSMMAENLVYYLSKELGENTAFVCDSKSDEDLQRIKESTNIKELSVDRLAGTEIPGRSALSKLVNYRRFLVEKVRKYENMGIVGMIVLGGDDLSEYYAGSRIALELVRLRVFSKYMRVFLAGQTVGPFSSWRVPLARRMLRDCIVYTRDTLTKHYLLKDLRLKKVYESRDLAWLDLPMQNDKNIEDSILAKYDLRPNEYIVLVPSGFAGQFTKNWARYNLRWLDIVNGLGTLESLAKKKIILLGHVVQSDINDDRNVIRHIVNQSEVSSRQRIIPIFDEMLPVEARMILGNGYFTITGRMHAAVSTSQMGKPAISLSYSVKYKGVLGEGLGMKDLIIEARGDDLWESGKIVILVMDKVEYVLSNYDSLVSRIRPAVEENKKLTMTQIEDIANKLKEKSYR
ncbi:conserved protein of unknown function [Mesotoga infera]|uniref:Polysaccharide pyruvyl transferase domain-containing protein n=1 Tax=Mesotoga infera TaxID=1236046 RepID=A0A7Z7LH67_9BACT|nr:polysaccharide pyruvyl transferase family protein [Mesotoga infera]SSC13672.1 conserved protein of unknown function [Mesotoga infera]